MFNTPYWDAVIADPVRRAFMVDSIVKAHEQDSQRWGDYIRKMITHHNSLKRQESEQHLFLVNYTGTTEERNAQFKKISDLTDRRTNVDRLLRLIADATMRSTNGYANIAIRVLHLKELGTVRNLDKMRNLMSAVENYDDSDTIIEWLEDHLELIHCNDCNEYEYRAKVCTTYHEEEICRECASENYTYSGYYGSYVPSDDARTATDRNGESVTIYYDDDNFRYDDDDDEYYHYDYQREPRIIGNYHSSKRYQRPIVDAWSQQHNRFFGVELEVELRGDRIDRIEKARILNDVINDGDIGSRAFFENDGSLNHGFEIVSQPMSLPMHRDVWSWLNDKEAVANLRSHNTSTCGLHVHVSRTGLTKLQIAKMVTFVNDPANEQLIRAIARRYAEGYCKIKEKKIGSAHQSSDRYEAINLTSQNTIEFRIFKGSLKYESVIAALEFCHSLVEFTRPASEGDIGHLTTDHYMNFLSDRMHKETTVLRPYIEQRLELA
jgi:hypothetical protein